MALESIFFMINSYTFCIINIYFVYHTLSRERERERDRDGDRDTFPLRVCDRDTFPLRVRDRTLVDMLNKKGDYELNCLRRHILKICCI